MVQTGGNLAAETANMMRMLFYLRTESEPLKLLNSSRPINAVL